MKTGNDVKRIEPRTLKGFRDYLPETMLPREWLIDTARRVYRSYGFAPIDTPALEYLDILTGKGSQETDKQLGNPVWHMHGGDPPASDMAVPFAMLMNLASAASAHDKDVLWGFIRRYAPEATPETHPVLDAAPSGSYFYFVHSYYADPEDASVVAGVTTYGVEFCSAVAWDNVVAVQFHPEKSGDAGLELYRAFVQTARV